ncbi:MAG: formylglycine-generating enzyme family protein [Gemmataceae bacterium]
MRRLIQLAAGGAALAVLATTVLTPAQADKAAVTFPAVERPTHKNYTETIPDTKVKFDMVAIPGGTYLMGSPETEKGRNPDEGPQHPVTLKGFWMGKCEVTWDEFDAWWAGKAGKKEDKEPETPKDADAVTRPTPAYADETFGLGREGNPLICVSWHTCMQYCRWLSVKTGKTYRLPTEAEWEWAARAGTATAYSFGNDPKDLGEYAWYSANSEDKPQPVGKKKANPWGLHDMYGNVAEFCLDLYAKDYYGTFPRDKPTLQPVNKPAGQRWSHPTRGGGWDSDAAACRSAARRPSGKEWIKLDPQRPQSIWWLTSAEFTGFRVVRPIEEQDNLKGFRSLVTRESK